MCCSKNFITIQFLSVIFMSVIGYSYEAPETINNDNTIRERILNVPTSVKMSCVQEGTSLNCVCLQGSRFTVDITKGTPEWNEVNRHPKEIYKLNFTAAFCNVNIGRLALKTFNLPYLKEIVIAGANRLILNRDSLAFSSNDKVKVTIEKIEEPFIFPEFDPSSVSTITLNNVKLVDFSSDNFARPIDELSFERSRLGKTSIIIENSVITTDKRVHLNKKVAVASIHFASVTFDPKPRYKFINLSVRKSVVFSNVTLEPFIPDLIDIEAETIQFENCTIINWRESGIRATVNMVSFIRSTLREPQKHAIMDLHPVGRNSSLSLKDVTLEDPAEGTLVTKFPKVITQHIFVEKCKCDLISYLLTTQSIFTTQLPITNSPNTTASFVAAVPKKEMEDMLSKTITCRPRNDKSNSKWVHPEEDCPSSGEQETKEEGTNDLLIGLLVCLFIMSWPIIFGLVVCYWRQKIQKKHNLVNKWRFHAPKQAEDCELIEENERIQYFVSPTKDASTFIAVEVGAGIRYSLPSKLMDDMRPNASEPKLTVDPGLNRNSQNWTSDSRIGSVIIHEDVDEYA